MANKRMFSKTIIDSDAFLDMPATTQSLYFHFVMRADDEGFIGNPKKIMRMVSAGEDDFKILVAKRYVLTFESGVVVIKHWLIHNTIQMDRFNPTTYQKEKESLSLNEFKAYTDRKQIGNEPITQSNLIKSNLSKDKIKDTGETSSPEIPLLIKEFESINPAVKRMYGNTTQRKACAELIKTYSFERTVKVIKETLPKTNGLPYFPTITTPLQLMDKWTTLESAIRKYQSEHKDKKEKYPVI